MAARPGPASGPGRLGDLGRQLAGAAGGAAVGATLWLLLSVPQHLINVIFSTLVGVGAGWGAGRWSRVARSWAGVALAVVVAAAVLLVTAAVITRQYLSWATDHLEGAPSHAGWDGPIGSLRLALDRAAARHGWTANASYVYWTLSLGLAGVLAWLTARPRPAPR